VVYFSTFTPSQDSDGIARIYALNYRTGNPIFNLNPENDVKGPKIDLSDRSKVIGTGIPSGTVISAIGGKPFAYTGFPGGLYSTHLKAHSTIIPISWREVSVKKKGVSNQ
jgi:type IV pilus assembly protein PilY1